MSDGDKYFAEIQPLRSTFKIQISKVDYKKILDALQAGQIIKIYPFEGKITPDNELSGGDYKIEIM